MNRWVLGVDCVKISTHVVCGVVDTKSGKVIDGVVSNTN